MGLRSHFTSLLHGGCTPCRQQPRTPHLCYFSMAGDKILAISLFSLRHVSLQTFYLTPEQNTHISDGL